ncbi:MAG: fumarate hydratase, partial [Oscillospiraceae bacterium]|nr:fumarate hydratase [Oscillospiraceae bacterium]
MKTVSVQKITETVKRLCIEANRILPNDVRSAIEKARADEPWSTAQGVLADIEENYRRAEKLSMPVCQDTGMA